MKADSAPMQTKSVQQQTAATRAESVAPQQTQSAPVPASSPKDVIVYTDGGCSGNPGPGGWGCILITDDENPQNRTQAVYSGGEKLTTNNRMELTAAVTALQKIAADPALSSCAVSLYTDSQYVKNGITAWIKGWKKNGWRTADKKPVKNKDLWEQLDALSQKLCPRWVWVKGHAGIKYNELVDRLTQEEINKLR